MLQPDMAREGTGCYGPPASGHLGLFLVLQDLLLKNTALKKLSSFCFSHFQEKKENVALPQRAGWRGRGETQWDPSETQHGRRHPWGRLDAGAHPRRSPGGPSSAGEGICSGI